MQFNFGTDSKTNIRSKSAITAACKVRTILAALTIAMRWILIIFFGDFDYNTLY